MAAVTARTSFRSILDKPLNQLTEDDISQLTREDCRKFLREKGMRRPSWNKSQAIQQVISLKALLDVGDDSGAGALRKALATNPVPVNSTSSDSLKEASLGAQVSLSVDDTVPSQPAPSVEVELGSRQTAGAENKSFSRRGACAINGTDEQMTIFYSGKVNVYDAVHPDKAQTIMHIAASSVHLPHDDPVTGAATLWSFPCSLQTASDKPGPSPANATISQTMQREKMVDCPQQYREKGIIACDPDRKVSLQRYLEKRKDRGRFKNTKDTGLTSSSLEMYSNNQVQMPMSTTSSPTQPKMSYALFRSVDEQGLVDLNDKDAEEG